MTSATMEAAVPAGPGETATTAGATPAVRAGMLIRVGLVIAVVAFVAMQYRTVAATLVQATAAAVSANVWWLVFGLGLTMASMVAFGALRRRTLRSAGADVSLREATAISYGAGAVHLTAPAGSVFSTGYVFRRLQRRGFTPAAVTWSLAVSGVVSTIVLAVLAGAGLVIGGQGSWTALVPGMVGAVALAGALSWAVRHPLRIARAAEICLIRINGILRRPAQAGVLSLRATISDLRHVRPDGRDWTAFLVTAALNWVLDLLCLWACTEAIGVQISPFALVTCYALAMAGSGVSPLPGGVGVVDTVLVLGLTAGGASMSAALGAVLLYRVLSAGSVILIGWTGIAAGRVMVKRNANDRGGIDAT